MDYVAHGLWSYIVFNRIKRPIYAVIFGLLPDTISWVIYAVYRLLFLNQFGKPVVSEIPQWVFNLYNMSHSLIVAGVIIALIYIISRKIPIYIFAWPLAIVLDIFTHTRDFLPTPFLWPLSSWKFPGIQWGTWQFMITNYSVIILCLIIILYKGRRVRGD